MQQGQRPEMQPSELWFKDFAALLWEWVSYWYQRLRGQHDWVIAEQQPASALHNSFV